MDTENARGRKISTKNICIFGDSIAYGAWDTHGGWGDRLRSVLHTKTIASDFTSYFNTHEEASFLFLFNTSTS
ncbi:MAG: hypothetical protein G01um101466_751, partial [Parcubacteria group bacterium Gr01-1014_66]